MTNKIQDPPSKERSVTETVQRPAYTYRYNYGYGSGYKRERRPREVNRRVLVGSLLVLLIGGGLGALQAMVISTGLPFTVVLLLMCWAIWKGLAAEKRG